MDPNAIALAEAVFPIVGILSVSAAAVLIYLGNRFFRFREKELALDAEARQQWAERSQALFEARIQRLESVVLALDPQTVSPRRELMEAPPAKSEQDVARPNDSKKVR
jgi:hypothetical protein